MELIPVSSSSPASDQPGTLGFTWGSVALCPGHLYGSFEGSLWVRINSTGTVAYLEQNKVRQ